MNKLWTLCKKSLYFFSSYLTQEDLSRLGRDYLKTGELIEMTFPDYDVRYIAINDGVDTLKSENELMAFKNIFNDWFISLPKTRN